MALTVTPTPTPVKKQVPAPNNPANYNSTVSTTPGVMGTNAETEAEGSTPADWGASANVGVFGTSTIGVQGSGATIGVQGTSGMNNGIGVQGTANEPGGIGVMGKGAEFAGQFQGNVQITGTLSLPDQQGYHTIAGTLNASA